METMSNIITRIFTRKPATVTGYCPSCRHSGIVEQAASGRYRHLHCGNLIPAYVGNALPQ